MRFTRPSNASGGFTLLELLLALGVVGLVLTAVTGLFVASRRYIEQQVVRIETDHAVRVVLDSLARDLRLGGACLPLNGDYLPLNGANVGTTDRILTRTGLVQPNLTCVRSATNADLIAGANSIPVERVAGFLADMGAYIRHPNGTGETFILAQVEAGTNTLHADRGLSQDYPATSGVYAIDARQYAVDTSNAGRPILTIARNGLTPVPFAMGVEAFNVQYDLARNCPPCDRVDLPENDAEWALVNQLIVTVTARARKANADGTYYRRTDTVAAKPRNLLPD